MKKIGIVSCIHQNNYGSLLQAYATKEFFESIGLNCEFIDYKSLKDVKRNKRKYFLKQICRFEYLKNKVPMFVQKLYLRICKNTYTRNISERYKKFDEFRNDFFNVSPAFSDLNSLAEFVDSNYHALIVGSDQLWLPVNIVSGFYSLGFISRKSGIKKISFATSIGQSFIPRDLKVYYQKALLDFDSISVREKKGSDILAELTGRTIEVISDPVFLLPKSKWISLSDNSLNNCGKYVLCYFLGNDKKRFIRIKKYCTDNNYELIIISNEERRCLSEKIADKIVYSASPQEFLGLIKDAELICTDSFHCTAFSIIFDKYFVPFFKYSSKDKYSTNIRIVELLQEFGIEINKIGYGKESLEELIIKCNKRKDDIISDRFCKAKEYLRKAL